VIANEVTRGIGQSAQETGVPHAFGVLTCDTLEQAIDRAGLKMGNKGLEAALTAVEMASLKQAVSSQPSTVSEKQIPRSARNDKGKRRAISTQHSAVSQTTRSEPATRNKKRKSRQKRSRKSGRH